MHTEPEVYEKITDQIEPHPNLVFSIKHTRGDFMRTFPFNPTIGIGKHKQLVEVQCQREYEGKGAHPNYIGDAVINGFEEYDSDYALKGLSDLRNNPNFGGIWTWARGGGWKGPYITNELWCDLNAFVISRWAQDTGLEEASIFDDYSKLLGLSEEDSKRFREIAMLSNRGVLLGRSSKLTDINPWWIRDHFMGGVTVEDFNGNTDEAWGKLNDDFRRIIDNGMTEVILEEKQRAVDIWKRIEALSQSVSSGDEKFKDYLKVSCTYGRIKYEIIQQAWIVMLMGMEGELRGNSESESITTAKSRYDDLWSEFEALKINNPQCASLYLPYSFKLGPEVMHGKEGMEKAVQKYAGDVMEQP